MNEEKGKSQCLDGERILKCDYFIVLMHPSIPPAPSPPPPGNCRAFARLVSPRGVAFANFALPGGRAFANPRAIPELLTLTRFSIRI